MKQPVIQVILARSAVVDAPGLERALEVGVDDYLVKPVEPKRLAARVKTILGRIRSRKAAGG